ncbi:MAG TPA: T9SS type A sorting domain-containing protein [Flavobacteriales bacterium]|nr:T9SS type A sorting domain-containing protein [Flavobacteriales bacterium]HIO73122.1 T9SS type A sorting domain-containing protein [Flavobacteriales bacterium]
MIFKMFTKGFLIGAALITCSPIVNAQAILLPSIGVGALPNDADTVCGYPIPVNPDMTFDSYPFAAGDTIPNFTLYDLNGDSINMADLLGYGKPVVIVALNYTCPYVRNKVTIYNDIMVSYSNQVTIIGIYQLEAHPDDDYSPNSGTFGNVSANVNQGIVVNQHATYAARKAAAQDLITNEGLNIPVYMDGPCNEWWTNFGPGPATGYIINANGTVFVKHGWFDKIANGHDIYCDLDSLFGVTCSGASPTGDFTMMLTTNDTVVGYPGTTIDVEADLINTSGADVLIEIERDQNNLSAGWESAICADICLNPQGTLYTFLLKDGETQHFWLHFYSDPSAEGQGSARMSFTNVNDFSNQYVVDMHAISEYAALSIREPEMNDLVNVFPNPFSTSVTIAMQSNLNISSIEIYDVSGQLVHMQLNIDDSKISLARRNLSPGMYYLAIEASDGSVGRQKIVVQ